MGYPFLLFDLDGTLVDSLDDLAVSINLLREELGLDALARERVAGAIGDGAALLVKRCLPEHPYAPRSVERFLQIYDDHLLDHTAPYPGIPELLESLAGCKLGVVTNKPRAEAQRILVGAGLAGHFQTVVGGDCAAARKPDAAPLQLALQRLGHQAEPALMVGDHHTDLYAGRAAGIDTCFCLWGMGHDDGLTTTLRAASPAKLQQLLTGCSP
ncbi:MAG: HAD family hydrolase [Desulfuromonas sp.]|nr:MAG: HAD family hydrolase [Desulfuromonas sp.]